MPAASPENTPDPRDKNSDSPSRLPVAHLVERLSKNVFGAPDLGREAMLLVHRTSLLSQEMNKPIFAAEDLAPGAAEVLLTLRSFPAPHRRTPTELSESILMSIGGLSKAIREVETRGFVARQRNAHDARSVFIELTPKGVLVANRLLIALAETDAGIVRTGLDEKELELLVLLLRKVLSSHE